MSDTFTNEQAAQLMAMAGVKAPVDELRDIIHKGAIDELVEDMPEGDNAKALAAILAKAKGVRETGEKLVDAHIDAVWATRKLSKLDAARQGLVASEHNRAAWAQLQTLRGEMKAAVRKASREGAHVAPKIADHSKRKDAARSPELDAFLLQHAGDTNVQQLAHLLGL